jgi:phosphoglycolate phosphatase
MESGPGKSLTGTRLVIFDLDGTLIDSQQDLVNSVNAARAYMGMGPLDDHVIASYVGRGAPILIRRSLGDSAAEADVAQALEYFLSYYRDHMLDHTRLYPGARETLDLFREHRIAMAVLTNKPVRFSEGIIEGLGLASHFQRVYGGNSFAEKKPHPIGIDTLVAETGADRSGTVMVGDSAVDVLTARAAGVMACGVTFGFQPESFSEAPPDLLIDDLRELSGLVLK